MAPPPGTVAPALANSGAEKRIPQGQPSPIKPARRVEDFAGPTKDKNFPGARANTAEETAAKTAPLSATTHATQNSPSMMPPRQFLRIVGLPTPEATAQGVDTVVVHAAQHDSDTERLRARTGRPSSPQTAATHLVDMLDAESEDPFTLELYCDVMRSCAEQGKDFILARVTTADPSDEERFYNSYYVAHHINKVLFRTQPEEGLLHRMRAKNPLNNMTIVGDVHYYRVTAAEYFAAHERYSAHVKQQAKVFDEPVSSTVSALEKTDGSLKSLKISTETNNAKLASEIDGLPFSPPPQVHHVPSTAAPAPSLRDVPPLVNKGMTLAERIRRALTSENASEGAPSTMVLHIAIREPDAHYERQPASSRRQNRRPSADDIFEFVAKSCPTTSVDDGGLSSKTSTNKVEKSRGKQSDSPKSKNKSSSNSITSASSSQKQQSQSGRSAKNLIERQPLSANSAKRPYSGWLPFFATQGEDRNKQARKRKQISARDATSELSVSISPVTLASRAYSFDRLRLHSASYRNNSVSGPTLTVDEWIDLKCGLAQDAASYLDAKSAHITSPSEILSPDSGRSSARFEEAVRIRRRIVESGGSVDLGTISDTEFKVPEKILQEPSAASLESHDITPLPRGAAPRIIYVAEFYATDDDFLMKSSVRAYFKDHALEANDSLLFTIPSAAMAALPDMEPHPALPGFVFSNEANARGDSETDGEGNNRAMGVLRRWLARHKDVLKVAALIYLVGGAVLISVFVPEAFVLPSAFVLIFALCLGFVFFVELNF